MAVGILTIQDIENAHKVFEDVEPRDLFYRAATELVDLAIHDKTKLRLSEAIAVLLQTWNISYYRFRSFNKKDHFSSIEDLLKIHKQQIASLRQRTIEDFCEEDVEMVRSTFEEFEKVLGKTGAAKCLHLLAPRFFPLWDTEIAKAYGLGKGSEADRYCGFMKTTKKQVMCLKKQFSLYEKQAICRNLLIELDALKVLDEYNYVMYTLPKKEKEKKKRHAGPKKESQYYR
jgi:hypothetical protein